MRQSAAVWCNDERSVATLNSTFEALGIEPVRCPSGQEALELAMTAGCSTLIVDFDLPGAQEIIRMASLLPPGQKPVLLAVASRAWPGTGQAFQSGASRILYRPIDGEQLKEAIKADQKARKVGQRKSARYEVKTLVYLEFENMTLPAISIDIGENGMAIQATETVPMNSNLAFRCMLPGMDVMLQGHAEVIWASDHGRAGLFFAKLSPAERKHLKQWLSKRTAHSKLKDKHAAPELTGSEDEHVTYAVSE